MVARPFPAVVVGEEETGKDLDSGIFLTNSAPIAIQRGSQSRLKLHILSQTVDS
jgi:hypothetical protein